MKEQKIFIGPATSIPKSELKELVEAAGGTGILHFVWLSLIAVVSVPQSASLCVRGKRAVVGVEDNMIVDQDYILAALTTGELSER